MVIDMESLFIDSQQVVAQDHLLRRRRRGGDVYDSCSSSSSSINEDEEDDDDLEVDSSSSPSPLQDMSPLLLQLPLKRGLSKHYNGKSESYTSLSNVKSLDDLAKQENPFNKKLKLCNSSFARKKKKPSTNEGSQFSLLFNGRRSSGFLGNITNINN